MMNIHHIEPASPVYRGAGLTIKVGSCRFAAGRLIIASYDRMVCFAGVAAGDRDMHAVWSRIEHAFPDAAIAPQPALDETARTFAMAWLSNEVKSLPTTLVFHGTSFQRDVWDALLTIPYGTTTDYKAIAETIGRPAAYRAVGNAIGANPIAVIVPCHRVLPASGGIGNYGYGAAVKRDLLAAEGAL